MPSAQIMAGHLAEAAAARPSFLARGTGANGSQGSPLKVHSGLLPPAGYCTHTRSTHSGDSSLDDLLAKHVDLQPASHCIHAADPLRSRSRWRSSRSQSQQQRYQTRIQLCLLCCFFARAAESHQRGVSAVSILSLYATFSVDQLGSRSWPVLLLSSSFPAVHGGGQSTRQRFQHVQRIDEEGEGLQ
jgi:hypothetical protein